ncbi:MAG: DUF1343 domain-containing protein [Deltaproteobacteria bacterium]|nr:DUF1343 domain-containing protein [Deltaproteobacteria bacterium]
MQLGIDVLFDEAKDLVAGKNIGLLVHKASQNAKKQHTLDRFLKEKICHVKAIFTPEHGLDSTTPYMQAVETTTHSSNNIPVYSLYGATQQSLRPTAKSLQGIDTLVIDLQDIGTRYYTYIWTTLLCMETCAKYKKRVIICDRPNPINGLNVEGEFNQEGYTSFVGLYPVPVRHGMTIGEMAHFLNDTHDIGCDLTVLQMERWQRKWYMDETGLPWINPSPNIRSVTQALLYPGMCLLEGTNVSEGRGTDSPFEVAAAPFIRPDEVIDMMNEFNFKGVTYEATEIHPNDDKWKGEKIPGVRLNITDRENFHSYRTGIGLIWSLYTLYHEHGFQWRTSTYEFVDDIPAIDLLFGYYILREGVQKHLPLSEISEWFSNAPLHYLRQRKPYLFYD